jgi:hypothetical protein
MTFDVIGAVEACYAGAGDDQAWLSGMLDAVSVLARGSGVQAQMFGRRGDGSVIVESRLAKGIPPDVLAECDRIFRGAPPEFWSPAPPVDYATTRARRFGGEAFQLEGGTLQRHGMEDHFGIFGADLDGRAVGLLINIPVGVPRFSPWVVHRLRSLAAHLTSAVRLRGALDAAGQEPAGGARASPDAVLDPAGRALDATGAARERAARASLGEAVRLMEKARGRMRRADPDEALRLWQGLVDGTWSLVEHHEADGKRYLLARRNHPECTSRPPSRATSDPRWPSQPWGTRTSTSDTCSASRPRPSRRCFTRRSGSSGSPRAPRSSGRSLASPAQRGRARSRRGSHERSCSSDSACRACFRAPRGRQSRRTRGVAPRPGKWAGVRAVRARRARQLLPREGDHGGRARRPRACRGGTLERPDRGAPWRLASDRGEPDRERVQKARRPLSPGARGAAGARRSNR